MNKNRKQKTIFATYRFDQDTYDKISIISKEDRRSATSLVEWLVDREFKKRYLNVKSNPDWFRVFSLLYFPLLIYLCNIQSTTLMNFLKPPSTTIHDSCKVYNIIFGGVHTLSSLITHLELSYKPKMLIDLRWFFATNFTNFSYKYFGKWKKSDIYF